MLISLFILDAFGSSNETGDIIFVQFDVLAHLLSSPLMGQEPNSNFGGYLPVNDNSKI